MKSGESSRRQFLEYPIAKSAVGQLELQESSLSCKSRPIAAQLHILEINLVGLCYGCIT